MRTGGNVGNSPRWINMDIAMWILASIAGGVVIGTLIAIGLEYLG